MRILLVRHGQSEWNESRRLQGQADIELSDHGRRQADALRPVIEGIAPCRSVTSDLRRARETADRIGAANLVTLPALREIDVGEWTGRPIAEIIADSKEAYAGWRVGTYTPPSGEHWSDFVDRVSRVIEDERSRVAFANLLVVCHGAVIRALLHFYLDLNPASVIPVGPASLTAIRLADRKTEPSRLELFNYRPDGLAFDAPD